MTETEEFALHPAMTPVGIFPGQPEHQVTHLVTDPRAAGPVRIGPMPADQAAVPGQQGGRGDDPMLPQRAGQGPDQRGQHHPVRPCQPRTADLTAEHGDLVT